MCDLDSTAGHFDSELICGDRDSEQGIVLLAWIVAEGAWFWRPS